MKGTLKSGGLLKAKVRPSHSPPPSPCPQGPGHGLLLPLWLGGRAGAGSRRDRREGDAPWHRGHVRIRRGMGMTGFRSLGQGRHANGSDHSSDWMESKGESESGCPKGSGQIWGAPDSLTNCDTAPLPPEPQASRSWGCKPATGATGVTVATSGALASGTRCHTPAQIRDLEPVPGKSTKPLPRLEWGPAHDGTGCGHPRK